MFSYLVQGSNITVVIDNKPYTVSKTHIAYNQLREALIAADWDKVRTLVEPKEIIANYGKGNITIVGETLLWKGNELHNGLTNRIVAMFQEGFSIEPMVNFMENLMKNPSKRSVDELYSFLEKGNLPITPDGCFLAYKKVRNDYRDVYSGSVLNKPAKLMTEADRKAIANVQGRKKEVSVSIVNGETYVYTERNNVDDNSERTCSDGLHFCSLDYLKSFGGDRIVILKINPRDVVSIPKDYNDTKGRCCAYTVIGEVEDTAKPQETLSAPVMYAVNSKVVVAEKPVAMPTTKAVNTPKVGTGAFAKGYTDGYLHAKNHQHDDDFADFDAYDNAGLEYWSYDEGYDRGVSEALDGLDQRYTYAGYAQKEAPKSSCGDCDSCNGCPTSAVAASAPKSWPFPKK